MKLKNFVTIYFSDKANELKARSKKNKEYMIQAYLIPFFGVANEPWHYRYVEKEAAETIHQSGMCLEEYIDTLD